MRFSGVHVHKRVMSRRLSAALTMLCVVLVVAACGSAEPEEGPQFVNDRRPTATSAPEVTQAPTEPIESTEPTAEPTQSASSLVTTRSGARFLYFVIDGRLTVYDGVQRTFTSLDIPADMAVIDFAASPTGDRAGILAVQNQRLVVQFYGADGLALSDPILLSVPAIPTVESTPDAGTPVSGWPVRSNQMQIDWVPQGNAVLVSGPGVAQHVSMSGAVMPISRTGTNGTVIKAIWSPMDSQVAIQTQLQNGEQMLFTLNTGHDEATEFAIFNRQAGMAMSNLQWLPSGLGFVMVAGTLNDGVVMNGDLYVYHFGDESPTQLASSGQGGPNATISHAAVSPDGHAVVYAVMVNDLGTWYLHSIWVKNVNGGPAVEIRTSSASPVISLQWSSEGIVWQQADGTLEVVDGSLQPRPLGTEPQATPIATPIDDTPVGVVWVRESISL